MKVFAWIYLVLFVLLSPLFIYDMYAQKRMNFTFIVGLFLVFYFFTQFIKKGNENKEK